MRPSAVAGSDAGGGSSGPTSPVPRNGGGAAGGPPTPPARVRPAVEAWESLFRAQVSLLRRFEHAGDFAPLRPREYDVLFTLSLAPAQRLRLRELNEEVLLSQPSLSRMVDRLVARGLVRRERAPEDARGTVVALTADGLALQRRIGRQHVRSIARYVGGALDEDELRTLTRLTAKLRAQRS